MSTIFGFLTSTPLNSFAFGMCTTLILIAAGFSAVFYLKFKDKSFIYFGLSVTLNFTALVMSNYNPNIYVALQSSLDRLRIIDIIVLFVVVFSYKLILNMYSPLPSFKFFPAKIFRAMMTVTLIARVISLIIPTELTIKVKALSVSLFFFIIIIYCILYSPKKNRQYLLRIGCGLYSIGMMTYPLARIGLFPIHDFNTISFVIVASTSFFSIVWLCSLLIRANEAYENAKMASLRNVATAFVQLRDLMNTPLQTLELLLGLLKKEKIDITVFTGKMDNSLSRLRKINTAMRKYENDVDWEDQNKFLEIK